MPSLFTKIIRREIPAKIVYETDRVIAFHDISPMAKVHILIVPKQETATINDFNESSASVMADCFLAAKQLAQDFGIAESGYRVVMNCNGDAGQTVFHVHLHLLGGEPLGGFA